MNQILNSISILAKRFQDYFPNLMEGFSLFSLNNPWYISKISVLRKGK